ncbi:MAG: gamma-glutamylcyclotransferase family protein [Ilumatobacteraceae bacterium]
MSVDGTPTSNAACRRDPAGISHVFVYGTLLPGDVRWHFLEPWVLDDGCADTVVGELFDTGFDYPAAVFADANEPRTDARIHGRVFGLRPESLTEALEVLDEVEDVVGGRYTRIAVVTESGVIAWSYRYGSGLDLLPIVSGNWLTHRPLA